MLLNKKVYIFFISTNKKGGRVLPHMETLTIDIWTFLLPYLSPITYRMLRLALPIFVRRTHRFPSVAQLCMQRFEHILLETYQLSQNRCHQLLQLVRESKFWLTGGTLLAILNGDLIVAGQDLDFCTVDTRKYSEPGEYGDDDVFPRDCTGEGGEYDLRNYRVESHRLLSGTTAEGIKTDIIFCDTTALLENLPAVFDLSFCGNMLGGNKLYLRSAQDILRRECALDMDIYLRHYNSMHINYVEGLFLRKHARIEKYRRRGYEIKIPRPISEPDDVAPQLLRSVPYYMSIREIVGLAGTIPHTEDREAWKKLAELRHIRDSILILHQWRARFYSNFFVNGAE
jgi:hypothetical protein